MGRGTDAAVAIWRRAQAEAWHVARMWAEALPEDRAIVIFLAGWIGAIFIVGYWLG